MGQSRADIVMVTDSALYGIEIKSDADTYTRLAGQVEEYNLHYDKNIIVVGTTHALHVKDHVPEWWGIITVEIDESGNPDFYVLKEATENPEVDPALKIQFLWRHDFVNIADNSVGRRQN